MGGAQPPTPYEDKLHLFESTEGRLDREPGSPKHAGDILVDLVGQAGLACMTLCADLKVVDWNPGAERLLGYAREEICGHPLGRLVADEEEKDKLSDYLSGVQDDSGAVSYPVTRMKARDGDAGIFCEWRGTPVVHGSGMISGVLVVAKDVTSQVESASAFRRLEKNAAAILESAPIGIYQADNQRQLVMANPEMAWMLGYESAEALMAEMDDIEVQMFAEGEKAGEFLFELYEGEQLNRFRSRLRRRDGSTFWALSYAKTTVNEQERISGFYGFAIDISHTVRTENALKQVNAEMKLSAEALKRVNAELKLSAIQDGLTRIPNRRRFDEVMDREWRRLARQRQPLSIILCDIDFFKRYNDSYGHQAGDACLQRVAQAIEAAIKRPSDLAARYGGEAFAIVLPNTEVKGALAVAERVRKAVRDLAILHEASGVDTCITLSLGVAETVPGPDSSPDELIGSADKALYSAKELGRNRCAIQSPLPPTPFR